jgi:hypothetical protein
MASSKQITVAAGTTATRLVTTNGTDNDPDGNTVVLTNKGAVDVLLGGEDVTAATGWRGLAVGATLVLDVTEDLYALGAGAAASAVDILRVK